VAWVRKAIPQIGTGKTGTSPSSSLAKPTWGAEPSRAAEAAEFARFIALMREKLGAAEVS
jgi:hypothetical protein